MADLLLGGLVINEILVDPNGAQNFDTDGNGTAASVDEYVELYNTSAVAIDISGVQLWDQGVGNWFTFPPGTILQPGGHAMVMAGVQSGGSLPTGGTDDLFFDAGRASPLINNGGDNVTVYDPSNDEYIQAVFNGDSFDDPTTYSGFPGTATQNGTGEDFGSDTDGESLQRTGDGADTFASDTPTPGTTNVCFANGAQILTPSGKVAVEDLSVGDLVETMDDGPQPVSWIYGRTWSVAQIQDNPQLAVVRIQIGALGGGCPTQELRLSQQHRVLVTGAIAQRMFGAAEVLIPAKALLSLPGVSLDVPDAPVTYYHLMLAEHQVIFSNDVATESLLLGPQVVASIPEVALREVAMLLDIPLTHLLSGESYVGPTKPARQTIQGRRAARLVHRHARNARPLIAQDRGLAA